MATTDNLPAADVNKYDYVIVGGGTAGCVIAARLAEYLPRKNILLIEAGPSDFTDDRVLDLRKWLGLLGGELDYDYPTTEQPMGNSHIRHSRAKVLGGCSSHNTLISFRPFEHDLDIWQSLGAKGWTFPVFMRVLDRLRNTVQPDDAVTGVNLTLKDGTSHTVNAKAETILCAGAVDTPRLMLHSGLGPAQQLRDLGIEVVRDIPGVGENLQDHPESIILWELNKKVPENQTTMDSDAGIFLRREAPNAGAAQSAANPQGLAEGQIADVMMHCYQIPFTLNTGRLGYPEMKDGYTFCMTPNIPRPRSRGRIYLTSADPKVKPALDFRYFTDPEGYDAATLVYGMRAARKVAEQAPFKDWIAKEVAPGPDIQTDEALSEYARRAAHTVYHPCGTTKMGDVHKDGMAVVDEHLKLRGLRGVRIADAGVFPTIPSINPMLTVLGVGERCAELILEEAEALNAEKAQARL
ncbi:hypothetical protein BN1708_009856, partial [Verticillium longisporum]